MIFGFFWLPAILVLYFFEIEYDWWLLMILLYTGRRCDWNGIVPSRRSWPAAPSVATRSDCAPTERAARGRGRWTVTDAQWLCTAWTRPPRTTYACWPSSAMARVSRVRGSASAPCDQSTTPPTSTPLSQSTIIKVQPNILETNIGSSAHFQANATRLPSTERGWVCCKEADSNGEIIIFI